MASVAICRWMTSGSLVWISGGDGNYRPHRSAERAQPHRHCLQEADRRTGGWCATLVRRHPPTDVVQVSCTTTTRSRSCPVCATAGNHWMIQMLSQDIKSIIRALDPSPGRRVDTKPQARGASLHFEPQLLRPAGVGENVLSEGRGSEHRPRGND